MAIQRYMVPEDPEKKIGLTHLKNWKTKFEQIMILGWGKEVFGE